MTRRRFWKISLGQNAAIFSLSVLPLQIAGALPTTHNYIIFALDQFFFSEINILPSEYDAKHSGSFVKLTCLSMCLHVSMQEEGWIWF